MIGFDTNREQMIYQAAIIRGGTSRGLFFSNEDIPEMGQGQEELLAIVMGRPDPLEVDGLGGGQYWNSKVAIVGRSQRSDADVDYTFVQVEPQTDVLDYNANCGNISAGVPLFALDRGLIALPDGEHEVRIWNTNTRKMLYAELAVKNSRALVDGDFVISGIPGSGAKVFLDFRDTLGASTGRIFPTGRVMDAILMEDGTKVEVTICDASNMVVFLHAASVGCSGWESLDELNAKKELFDRCAEIRGKAAALAGFVDRWQDGRELLIPPVCMITGPGTYTAWDGQKVEREDCSLIAKLAFTKSMHPTFMGSSSCCLTAAATVPGTIPNEVLPEKRKGASFVFGHPGGIMPMEVDVVLDGDCNKVSFRRLGFGRTARKIADCSVYVRPAAVEGLKVRVVPPHPTGRSQVHH